MKSQENLKRHNFFALNRARLRRPSLCSELATLRRCPRLQLIQCLSVFFVTVIHSFGNGNPEDWELLNEQVSVGHINYIPFSSVWGSNDNTGWNTQNWEVEGGGLAEKGFGSYADDRYAYIDFGNDHENFHIIQTWTRYKNQTNAPGFAEVWWSDSLDKTVDPEDVTEDTLNFCKAGNVTQTEVWIQDTQVNDIDGGITPSKRYLILRYPANTYFKCNGISMVGYVGPIRIDTDPKITIDENSIQENKEAGIEIGNLNLLNLAAGEMYTISLSDDLEYTETHACFGIDQDNMKLLANCSFDYEQKTKYDLKFKITDSQNNVTFRILSINIENTNDINGIADTEMASLHPSINVGDFVIWNANNGENVTYWNDEDALPLVNGTNKILIKGGSYSTIKLNLMNVGQGNDAQDRVEITNFLGQVYTQSFRLKEGRYWRLSGMYDPDNQLGDTNFRGCVGIDGVDGQFGYSASNYGIWISHEWHPSDVYYGINLGIEGFATGYEIDHLEISDGGFAGALIKTDKYAIGEGDNWPYAKDVHLHHLYIHDTGGEGIYLGETQHRGSFPNSDDPTRDIPATFFKDLLIENIVCLRTGVEALQVGQLIGDCSVRNSVFWGAMEWRDPFQAYQDNCVQFIARDGNNTFENNILLAGGDRAIHAQVRGLPYDPYDIWEITFTPNEISFPMEYEASGTSTIQNNVIYAFRNKGVYTNETWSMVDRLFNLEYTDNFWGGRQFTYDQIKQVSDQPYIIEVRPNYATVSVTGNVLDETTDWEKVVDNWDSENSLLTDNNAELMVLAPRFENLIGKEEAVGNIEVTDDYLKWYHFAQYIYQKSGIYQQAPYGGIINYEEGDIVQSGVENYRTRFYRCQQANNGTVIPFPPDPDDEQQSNDYWELITWSDGENTSYYPPDDARLVEGSFYFNRGIGLGGDAVNDSYFDTDNDGLADSWERRYGLSWDDDQTPPSGALDTDGDGTDNATEYLLRTNPIVAERSDRSSLLIQDKNQISWTPPKGRAWRYEYSTDLQEWFPMTGEDQYEASDGTEKILDTDTHSDQSSVFYLGVIQSEQDGLNLEPSP